MTGAQLMVVWLVGILVAGLTLSSIFHAIFTERMERREEKDRERLRREL